MKKKSNYFITILIVVIFIIISSFTKIIDFVTDYKWFRELGYTKTFFTKLFAQLKIGVPTFVVVFFLIMLYFITIKKNYYKLGNITVDKKNEKRFNGILGVISAIISLFVARVFAGDLWFTILQFLNSTDYGTKDPIFNKDISFYIFKLPLISIIVNLLLSLAFLLIILTVVFYFTLLAIRRPQSENSNVFEFNDFNNTKDRYRQVSKKIFNTALIQIAAIGFSIFIIIAINYVLKTYYLVYSPRGVAYGASYTDVHVTLILYKIMAAVAAISSIGVLIGLIKRKVKIALAGPILLIAIGLIGNIATGVVQKFVVEPDEISKEQEYLKYNIELTQKAYGLDDVTNKEYSVEQNLTKEDILNNPETIENIKINDYRPAIKVYNQLQAMRLYYQFNDIDVDRYIIDGKYTQVFLSARELDQEKLNDQAKTWINKHLKYTHGYGFVLSPVNSVTSEGQPRMLVKNIPPLTDTDLKIERPEIYFGESTDDYVILNTDEEEFDYPQGEDNAYTIYEGDAGIKLNGINKLLFAIRERSFKLLVSDNINSDSRIAIYRNINERVRKIASFIEYDSDPYLVLNQDNGKLYWIIDGYTMSNRYPYSQPYTYMGSEINYIRNSVKVVIDAYNGDVKYYIFDENDPIIMTYKKIFPDLFLDKDELPDGLKTHIRYPITYFNIQANIYKEYHMDNPRVFYNMEDAWDIAKEKYLEGIQNVEPSYLMFKLPDEEKAEFLLTIPYTPKTKQNMTSLLVARNDGDNYGKLFIYKFPKNKTIDGPMIIESKIDQDSEISPQLSLWSQKGSAVLRGNIMVVPVENSLLYVEPIYIQADNENSLPEVKRVIVAYKDNIVMEESLEEALNKIFGIIEEPEIPEEPDIDIEITDDNIKEIIKQANDLFNKAKEASQKGNWAEYGEYLEKLEDVLNKLNSFYDSEVTE